MSRQARREDTLSDCMGDRLPARWWTDPEILLAEYRAHGTLQGAGAAHPPSARTLGLWWMKHGLPDIPRGPRASVFVGAPPDSGDEWLLAALKKLGDQASVEEIADHADVSPKRVRDALERLGHEGYRVAENEHHVVLQRVPPAAKETLHPSLFDGEHVRVGIVSDTHLGANEEALAELHLAYDIFASEGISQVWHAGDIGCGIEIFGAKQHSEAHVHTLDEQRAYVVDHYPRRDGIVTRAIGGNHDLEGLAGKAGWDLVQAVANERPDIEYLGPFSAWVETRPGTGRYVHLLHGKGGMSYSYSYKAQKLVDGYPSARKPAALIVGHWHVRGNIRARDVEVLWPGCFEWQSQFMERLGLQPAVGFHILNMTVAEDGSIVRWVPEWFPYFPGRTVT